MTVLDSNCVVKRVAVKSKFNISCLSHIHNHFLLLSQLKVYYVEASFAFDIAVFSETK